MMRPELKIGVVIGIVLVAIVVVLFVKSRDQQESAVPEIAPPIVAPEDLAVKPAAPAEPEKPSVPAEPAVTEAAPSTEPAVQEPPAEEPQPPVMTEPVVPEVRYHEVVKGDTLAKISEKYYGNSKFWSVIYRANEGIIKNPDVLQPGWKLRIPYPHEVSARGEVIR